MGMASRFFLVVPLTGLRSATKERTDPAVVKGASPRALRYFAPPPWGYALAEGRSRGTCAAPAAPLCRHPGTSAARRQPVSPEVSCLRRARTWQRVLSWPLRFWAWSQARVDLPARDRRVREFA